MKNTLLLCSALLLLQVDVDAYKILVYTNVFGHSHLKVMASVADTLTDAGHNVTMLMPIVESQFINKTTLKSTKNVIFIEQNEHLKQFMAGRAGSFASVWTSNNANPFRMIQKGHGLAKLFSEHCRNVMSDKEIVERMKAENFDLAITEPFDTCAYAFFEAIKIRAHVAVFSTTRFDHVSDVIGQPSASSYVPGMQSVVSEKMNIWQRLLNRLLSISSSYMFSAVGDADYEVAKEYYPEIRSWREVLPEASFIFTNQMPLLDFPAPTFDKIVPIGGLSVKTDKKSLKLEEKWSNILDIRKKNVLIAFGTNAKSTEMPENAKKSFLRVFESMPDTTFIWKYEDAEDPFTQHLPNVFLSSWLPQNELLADKRITVFVTHGGLASVIELAMMGKPCVMIPLMADQTKNAEMLKRHGGALVINKHTLEDSQLVRNVIETVMEQPSFRENAEKLAELLHNFPTKPKETLLKHVEFAARFGKLPSLDNYGRHQSLIVYYFIDIIAIASLIVIITGYILFRTTCFVVRVVRGGKQKSD